MFGSRRHRANPPPLTSGNVNPNAATAAAAVFNKNRERGPSLSAAAAAAALRSRPITPTNVAEVQTKRTMRRNASLSSSNSVPDLHHGRPGLQRRGSSGSMTERTFRSPSPHRPATSGSGHRQSQSQSYTTSADMPPVPALPKVVDTSSVAAGTGTTPGPKRTGSLGIKTTPLRVASQRLGTEGTPSWFGAANVGEPGNIRRTDPAMASPPSSPPQPPMEELSKEEARPSSRSSSINFSYPARMRVGSPPVSPADQRNSLEYPRQEPHSSQQPARERHSRRVSSESATSTIRSRPQSATTSSDQTLVYDPNSRRMVPRASLAAVEQADIGASEKPTQSKRMKQAPARVGSHLAQGTMGRTKSNASPLHGDREARRTVIEPRAQYHEETPVSRGVEDHQYEPAVKALIQSPRSEAAKIEQQHFQEDPAHTTTAEVDSSAVPHLRESMRSPPTMRRQPSVVKEEPEPESEPESARRSVSDAIDAVPSREKLYPAPVAHSPHKGPLMPKLVPNSSPFPAQAAELPAQIPSATEIVDRPEPVERNEPRIVAFHPPPVQQVAHERTQSASPARQAHFGPVSESLKVKHSPPPRSISPRKSALKQHSPSRGASPSDDTSEASAGVYSPEEQPVSRKKSVRVSFNDESNVVVGESALARETESPVLPSPQAASGHRHWFSNIGRSKKEFVPLDDDEVMKPRPALPSFGSVRDKKPREQSPVLEERPLVRPMLEVANSPPLPATPTLAPSDGARSETSSLGQSSDHALAALLQQDQEQDSRIPANISRFREPLPPVVTSIEGSGYVSDTSDSEAPEPEPELESEDEPVAEMPAPTELETVVEEPVHERPLNGTLVNDDESHYSSPREHGKSQAAEVFVPSISITEATPPPSRHKLAKQHLDVPGGFPDDESDVSTAGTSRSATPAVTEAKSDNLKRTTFEPTAQPNDSQVTPHTPATVLATRAPIIESSDSESSIYSDAYEDLSDIEGDGFQSLDAVLEAPNRPAQQIPAVQNVVQQEHEVPRTQKLEPELSMASTSVESQIMALPGDDWERAKAYWRGLTTDKRALLEKEAREDAAIEADMEESKQASKPKKKKSVERRNSERKAIAVHMAQQIMAQQQQEQQRKPNANSERSYMIKPGTKWPESDVSAAAPTLRTTMRSSPPQQQGNSAPGIQDEAPRLRKSLRTNGSSTRSAEVLQPKTRPSLAKTDRPMSFPPPDAAPIATLKAQRRRTSEMGPSSVAPAATSNYYPPSSKNTRLRRRGSDSSESSFRRMRSSIAGQGFGFRKSMRQSPPASPQQEASSGKKFLRALSPTGSPFRKSLPAEEPHTSGHMRRTLRDAPTEAKSGGIRMPSFGLSSSGNKNASKRASGSRALGSTFSSRFGDSSDEDDGLTSGFRSRFEESSDDDNVPAMAVAMPRTMRSSAPAAAGHRRNQPSNASTALIEEQESEELPDSSDEEKPRATLAKQPQITTSKVRRSGSGRGTLASPQTSPVIGTDGRPSTSKRSSFMSALRRKKPDSHKISRPEMMDSAARRDTKLERSVDRLRDIRSSSGGDDAEEHIDDAPERIASPKQQPASPKLQKRVTSLPAPAIGGWQVSNEQKGIVVNNEMLDDHSYNPGGGLGITGDEKDPIEALRRPSTSGNLGTRTLSGYSGSGAQPGFLQRRTVSSGVMSMDAGMDEGVKKKKKFGALRRMFRLD